MAEHNETGKKGEEAALAFLKEKGYEILELNWRLGNLEADIIAKQGDQLVVVEVKTRASAFYGPPQTWVNKAKQRNLILAANHYVERHKLDLEVRFDIISVILIKDVKSIDHIEDAFFPLV